MSIFKPTENYSVVDPVKLSLDKHIIQNGKLNPSLRQKIIDCVNEIAGKIQYKPEKIWLIGSSLTYQWTQDSDLDVTIFIHNKSPEELKKINTIAAKHFNAKVFLGQHPLNFYHTSGVFFKFKADAIYDVENDKWIKKPIPVDAEAISEIIEGCKVSEEFQEILNEYAQLKNTLNQFSGDHDQLKEIMDQTLKVSYLFNKIRDTRREDFNKRKHEKGLPSGNFRCSNIIFKLLESYGLENLSENVSQFISGKIQGNSSKL